MSKYDYGMELPSEGSIRWGYESILNNSKVLEMGCANGLLTRHLKLDKNCEVDVVEIDEEAGKEASEFANIALIGMTDGNLENDDWFEKLKGNKYDVITFLDVLEHLRDPEAVLKKSVELLSENGYICITLPNIGHNSVLINLINNKFEYQNLGIMDNTHVRFFCQDTLEKLIDDAGLVAVKKSYTQAPVGAAFIENSYDDISSAMAKNLQMRENGELFQFLYVLRKKNNIDKSAKLEYKGQVSKLYYDLGEGFSEDNIISVKCGLSNEEMNVKFDLTGIESIKKLRWDPLEKSGLVIAVKSIKVSSEDNGLNVNIKAQNAVCFTEEGDVFVTGDPNYIIQGALDGLQSIEINSRIKVVGKEQLEILGNSTLELSGLSEKYEQALDRERTLFEELENGKLQFETLNTQYIDIVNQYNVISNSTFWKLTKPARAFTDILKKVLKKNRIIYLFFKGIKSIKNKGIKQTASKIKSKRNNKKAMKKQMEISMELALKERKRQSKVKFEKDITFSIVVPLYNTPIEFLRAMIESVQEQTYGNWELCMADGSDSDHPKVEQVCLEYLAKDSRIKYKKLEKNLGISGNTNACLEMAIGDFIGLFDHDDLLHPSVLYYYMKEICKNNADFIYCDELTFQDKLSNITVVNYKPDFAIDNLRANNYICHFTAFDKKLYDKVGGFRPAFDGSQDYDMILRLTEQASCIRHVPRILYFWRAHKNSVASDISAKMYTIDAAKMALAEHLERCDLKAEVVDSKVLSWYRMKYEIIGNPLVSILIPNKDSVEVLKQCIDSILGKTTYTNYEIVVVENNSTEPATFAYYNQLAENDKIKVVTWEEGFNYSKINNFGFKHCKGEYVVLLNNDIEVITPEWIEEMLMFTQRSDVGATGAMLYYPNDTIQHAGVILGIGGVAGHSHKYFQRGDYGYMGRLQIAQNLSAVTAACMMVKRSVYEELEGLDENFAVAFNDVDFCMRIREAGHLICWTPFAELYHHESISRGYEDTPEKQKRFKSEIDRFDSKWSKVLKAGDPYYNKNLTLEYEDFRID